MLIQYILRVFYKPGPVLASMDTVVNQTLSLSKNSLEVRDRGPGDTTELFLLVTQGSREQPVWTGAWERHMEGCEEIL